MKVLFAANEAFPIYKLGGLGDVIGSLPKHLSSLGIDVRIIIPHHPEIKQSSTQITSFYATYNQRRHQVKISQTFLPHTNIPVYLVSDPTFLSTATDASDNHADKYAFFSLTVSQWLNSNYYWQPNIVHLHDWHVSLIPVILEHKFNNNKYKYLLTIHNLAYQANTSTPVHHHLGLPSGSCQILDWDFSDFNLNILMEGILHSDKVNTVSPQYAKEILTPEFSFGLDDILKSKSTTIEGILNGLDQNDFNPFTDNFLDPKFSLDDIYSSKRHNKINLYRQIGVKTSPDHKLIGFVGRVDPVQKGIDHIIKAIKQDLLPPQPHHFIFLGVGDHNLEQQLHLASRGKQNSTIITRFDEALARKIYASSDLIVIPSTYEPCGLVQMIAMRYGAVPIAHAVGGLADTITPDYNGFLFSPLSVDTLSQTINTALSKISTHENHSQFIDHTTKTSFLWKDSAKKYHNLYHSMI